MDFNFFSYQKAHKLLAHFIQSQPKKGRGLVKKLAEHLGTSSPQVSQFLSGLKPMSFDQAICISIFFHWNKVETDYFLTLVELSRSDHHLSKIYLNKKLDSLRNESLKISTIMEHTHNLTDQQKAQFYSSWVYSAIRLFCSLGSGQTYENILKTFPEIDNELDEILRFLEDSKLIIKKEGRFYLGIAHTFLAKGSPYLRSHHINWRIRAIERSHSILDQELMYTCPMSISKAGFQKVRIQLQEMIKRISNELPSHGDAEELIFLNIDLIKTNNR